MRNDNCKKVYMCVCIYTLCPDKRRFEDFFANGHISRLTYGRNIEFGIEVPSHKKSKKIKLNKAKLAWLRDNIIITREQISSPNKVLRRAKIDKTHYGAILN